MRERVVNETIVELTEAEVKTAVAEYVRAKAPQYFNGCWPTVSLFQRALSGPTMDAPFGARLTIRRSC